MTSLAPASHHSPFSNYGFAVATANAMRTPDKIALTYRGEDYTFQQFNERVNVTANALLSLGLKPNMRIGVLVHDALPIAECYLALAKIGVTIVALNPYWDDDTMHKMLSHCDVHAMLTQSQDNERIAALRAKLNKNILCVQLEAENLPADTHDLATAKTSAVTTEPPVVSGGEDPLAFFFTSGTTGLPKAVVHSHNSCRSMADIWYALPLDEDSIWGTGTIIWGVGFPCTIGAALFVGMHVALKDDFGPAGFLEAIKDEPISHFCVIPSFFSDLLSNHDHADIDLSAVSMVLLGGEPLANNLLEKIKARIPDAALYAFYGQTEAPYTCFGRLDDGSQASNVAGLARPSCAAQVLGPNGQPIIGKAGELAVTGPHRLQEYFGQPDKTAEVLVGEWFFSGDLALQDEQGRITVLGRREDAIVRQGQYIQPLEVEDAALGVDGVSEAGAVSVDLGTEDQGIILALTSHKHLTEEGVLSELKKTLAEHALPDRIVIVDELPHSNDNSGGKGKLLRREIREKYQHLLAG